MKHANEQKALWKPISNPVCLLILCPQKTELNISYRKQKRLQMQTVYTTICRGKSVLYQPLSAVLKGNPILRLGFNYPSF